MAYVHVEGIVELAGLPFQFKGEAGFFLGAI
jgi:hypothetical protein